VAGIDVLFRAAFDASGVAQGLTSLSSDLQKFKRDTEDVTQASEGADRALAGVSGKLIELAKAVGGAYVIGQLVGHLRAAAEEAIKAEVSQARLAAVIQATGKTAGFTADELADFATQLQETTGISDEAIKDAMAVLATFRSVSGPTFLEATQLAADMAAVFGTDLRSAAVMLGKALEDPVQGIMALRRAGITFSEDQKALIASFVEAGDTAKAQGVVLEALRTQVGGAAKAVEDASLGLHRMKEALGDAKEGIGELVLNAVRASGVIQALTKAFSTLAEGLYMLAKGQRDYDYTSQLTAKSLENLLKKKQEMLAAAEEELKQLDRSSPAYAAQREKVAQLRMEVKELTTKLGEKRKEEEIATAAQQAAMATADAHIKTKKKEKETTAEVAKAVSDEAKAKAEATTKTIEHTRATEAETTAVSNLVGELKATKVFENLWKPPAQPVYAPKVDEFARYVSRQLGSAITDGILGTLRGDKFADAWGGVWKALSNVAAERLDRGLATLLSGGDFKSALQSMGVLDESGKVSITGVGTLVGSAMLSYGVQKQNRGVGAAGGAIAGASMGFTIGGPWGAVIGAIIGGLYGYFASGQQKKGVHVRYGGGATPLVDISGPTEDEEKDMLRQLRSTWKAYRVALLDVFDALGGIPEEALKRLEEVRIEVSDRVEDPGSWWRRLLSGTIPRAMVDAVRPQLEAGLQALGVSAERAKQELDAVFAGDFNEALKELAHYITVFSGLREVSENLGQSLDEVRDKVNQTMRESFLQSFDEALQRADQLGRGLSDMLSEEQVHRAEQLLELAREQYQQTLRYIADIERVAAGIQDSVEHVFASFEEQRAREQGPAALAQYYQERMSELQRAIQEATSPEQVQRLWQDFLQTARQLWGLNVGDNQNANYAWRQWVEEQIRATENVAKQMLEHWEQEALQRQQQLKDKVDAMTGALAGAATNLESLEGASRRSQESMDSLSDATDRAALAVENLASALQSGATAVGGGASLLHESLIAAAAGLEELVQALAAAAEQVPDITPATRTTS
jgi:hypothetical protein